MGDIVYLGEKSVVFVTGCIIFLLGLKLTIRSSNEAVSERLSDDTFSVEDYLGEEEDEDSPLARMFLGACIMTLGVYNVYLVLAELPMPEFYRSIFNWFGF